MSLSRFLRLHPPLCHLTPDYFECPPPPQKKVFIISADWIPLLSYLSFLLPLKKKTKDKCIDYEINDTIFARFQVIMTYCTETFSSLVLKKKKLNGCILCRKANKKPWILWSLSFRFVTTVYYCVTNVQNVGDFFFFPSLFFFSPLLLKTNSLNYGFCFVFNSGFGKPVAVAIGKWGQTARFDFCGLLLPLRIRGKKKKKKRTPKTAISSERREKKDVKICFVGNVPKQPRWLEILLLKLTLWKKTCHNWVDATFLTSLLGRFNP